MMLAMIILAVVIGAVVGGIFIFIGVKLAKVEKGTFGKSVGAAILIAIINGACGYIIAIASGGQVSPLIGFLIGLIIALFVIKGIFKTSFGRAFLVWIFVILSQIIAAATVAMVGLTILSQF